MPQSVDEPRVRSDSPPPYQEVQELNEKPNDSTSSAAALPTLKELPIADDLLNASFEKLTPPIPGPHRALNCSSARGALNPTCPVGHPLEAQHDSLFRYLDWRPSRCRGN